MITNLCDWMLTAMQNLPNQGCWILISDAQIKWENQCGEKNELPFMCQNVTYLSHLNICSQLSGSFPGGSVVKNPPANVGDAGSIPRSGRSRGGGNGQPTPVFLAGGSWTEEPGELPSMGSQRVSHDWPTEQHMVLWGRVLVLWQGPREASGSFGQSTGQSRVSVEMWPPGCPSDLGKQAHSVLIGQFIWAGMWLQS